MLNQLKNDYHDYRRFDHLQLHKESNFLYRIRRMALFPSLFDCYDLPITPDTCHDASEAVMIMSQIIAHLYVVTGNFLVLHAFTATHAVSMLMERDISMELKCKSLRHLWRAFCAAYVSEGAPDFDQQPRDLNTLRSYSWTEIIEKGINDSDEHVIKMIFASFQEFQKSSSSEVFRLAAARRLNPNASVKSQHFSSK
eukprot:gb/GECH01007788.1/.p1 GENE.gb/GECH01007788.1/~~gb/GECH01007788.1/.p1  ORF type:complete len:197 (+),score=29.06 gb/GECH01007788.1/:1-591(+)